MLGWEGVEMVSVHSDATRELGSGLLGTIVIEKCINALGAGGRVPALSKESNLGGSEGEGGVNNEPFEISW